MGSGLDIGHLNVHVIIIKYFQRKNLSWQVTQKKCPMSSPDSFFTYLFQLDRFHLAASVFKDQSSDFAFRVFYKPDDLVCL